jgi:hypothetical protein
VCEPSLLAWAEREESLQLTCDICYEVVLSAGGSAARCAFTFHPRYLCESYMLTWRIRLFDKFEILLFHFCPPPPIILDIHCFCCSFGLLENCAHSFCLSCIREWRASADAVRTEAVRACPICRVESHFVVPWHVLLHAPFLPFFFAVLAATHV